MNKKLFLKIISVFLALVTWQIVSMAVDADFLLASPIDVVIRLGQLTAEKNFLKTALFSFLRITSGFFLSFVTGIFFAVLAGRFHIAEILLWPYVITVKAVPIASFIILCLLWLNFNVLTVFITFLISFPVIYSNALQGIKNADNNLLEVAYLYEVPFKRKLLYIFLPSIKPFIISACSVAIGMAWKAGVAAEVIGVIKGSIGGKLYDAKIYFQNADLLAWTVLIIVLSVVSEKIVLMIIKKFFKRIEKI